MDEKKVPEEVLFLHEELLKAQLQVIRRLRGRVEERTPGKELKSRSNMSIVIDLLNSEGPLHVSEIIRRAKKRFDVALDRESLVSAMVKKVRGGVLVRTAPNTFGIAPK